MMMFYSCRRAVVAAACALVCVLCAHAADYGKYTGLINKVSKLSSENIVKLGDRSLAQGRGEEAMVLYMVVCERADDVMSGRERGVCASAHVKAGDIYYGRGDYTRALEFYVSGLKVCEGGGGRDGIAKFYKNIGNVYCQYQDYEKGPVTSRRPTSTARPTATLTPSASCSPTWRPSTSISASPPRRASTSASRCA